MDLGLRDKVALVAAASKGLGKAAAMRLAQEGCDVAIVARGEEALRATAQEIEGATGRRALALVGDVGLSADCERAVAWALRTYGRVDVLVNNAGGPPPGVFSDMADEDWEAAFHLTLMSAVRLTRLALPGMRERGWGRIINITSLSVKQPIPSIILSNTMRAGVVAMAKTLSLEVAAEGITVNNVCPGSMATDRARQLAASRAEEEGITVQEALERSAASIPAGRIGQPDELAAMIAFLASEQAAYITGTTIQVDGGTVQSLL